MRRFVLGTAGHVDHGKTTLVQALTGVDTDRLPEEKRRGITIELGFAPWDLGDGVLVSVIDVPGHRRLVHTMIAGATGMEVVLLVVAADEGVMPQTREHIAACELLGIRRVIVAVTKLDRVGEELAHLAGEEAHELLQSRFDADVVICSARTGQGLDRVRNAVKNALLALPTPSQTGRVRLSVDRVFSVRGAGTVVTGTLVQGTLVVGAPLLLVGQSKTLSTSARNLHVHDKAVEQADAPTRLAVNLAGLPLEAVHRGDVLTNQADIAPTRVVDVTLRATADIRHGMSASMYVGTARATARISLLVRDDQEANPDSPMLARLRLTHPLVVVGGDRFVLRGSDIEGPCGAVVGGGTVLDARPPRMRARRKRRAVLEALAANSAPQTINTLIDEASPRPFLHVGLAGRFLLDESHLEKAAEKLVERGEIARLKPGVWMRRSVLLDLASSARALVADHHKKAPLDRGLVLETLRRKLADASSPEAAEQAIRLAASTNALLRGEPIVVEADVARLAGFHGQPSKGSAANALAAATRAVVDAGLRGVTEHGIGEVTTSSPREVKAILAKLVRDNMAVHAGELWFSCTAVDDLRKRIVAHFEKHARMTVADFKAISGLGRKQTIMLLEMFDREGLTRREGDERLLAKA